MAMTFALFFGNRGFFPGELIADARRDMIEACERNGYGWLAMDESLTRYGGIETLSEGRRYAAFLREHRGKYDGVILCLPNFGDENGAAAALQEGLQFRAAVRRQVKELIQRHRLLHTTVPQGQRLCRCLLRSGRGPPP